MRPGIVMPLKGETLLLQNLSRVLSTLLKFWMFSYNLLHTRPLKSNSQKGRKGVPAVVGGLPVNTLLVSDLPF